MLPGKPIRVLCVDDVPDVAAVIRLMVEAEADMECVGVLTKTDALVEEVRRLTPDVVVLDATMPGKDPFQALHEIRDTARDVATVMYSGHDDQALVDRAAEAGAWGWVGKHEDPRQLIQAVRDVAAGQPHFPSSRA